MPFKSEAQHRAFRAMMARGEISKKTFNKWMRETKAKYGKEHPIKPLPEKVEKTSKVLTTAGRERIKEKNFAIPEKDAYPIHDLAHARNALARVSAYGTPEEKSRVRGAVYSKYPGLKKRYEEREGESPVKQSSLLKIAYGGEEEFSMTESTGPILKRVGSAPPSPGRMKELGKMSAQRKYMGQQAEKVKGFMGMGGPLQPGLGKSLQQARPAFLKQLPREKQLEWAGSTKTGMAKDIIKFAACNSKRKSRIRARDVKRAADEARKEAAFGSWYPPILKEAMAKFKIKMPKYNPPKSAKSTISKDTITETPKPKIPSVSVKSKPPVIKGDVSDLRGLKKHLYKTINK